MNRFFTITAVAFACVIFTTAFADWWINGDGTGFVGKGDVQSVYGWNDADLQANAGSVSFRANLTEVSEVSWVCTNSNNGNTQERSRITTLEAIGNLLHAIRYNPLGHVTGFDLLGWDGTPAGSSSTEGPPLNSCPAGPWSLTQPAGEPVIITTSSTGEVSIDGDTWFALP